MSQTHHVDLCIIGSGSGNSIPDERFDDWRIALIDDGPQFGGTCLNVGCIPTKMYVHPADLARMPEHAVPLGVDLTLDQVHWAKIRDRIFGRIDPISAGGERYRAESRNIQLFRQRARFIAEKTIQLTEGTQITADRFVLAAGSRVRIPEILGLAETPYETSDTVMRLAEPPRTMIIIGAGYVAAEFAHVFSAYGTAVTLVGRKDRLLRHEDGDISSRFTRLLGERVDLRLQHRVVGVRQESPDSAVAASTAESESSRARVVVDIDGPDGPATLTADVLLVATGRIPNGDRLDLGLAGVALDEDGYIVVDEYQRTTADGIFALGDVSSHHQLKHVANQEARVVQHNLLHPDAMIESDHRFIPHAVFSSPQVASVGLTEEDAVEHGIDYVAALKPYADVAYGWAMGETGDHVVKLLADRQSAQLIGAHLIGPEASSLIQPLIQAMSFGLRADELARGQYWIHPAMAEVIENALLALPLEHHSPASLQPVAQR
ncbi:MAG: mycothione reductase [Microlunatus sp.]